MGWMRLQDQVHVACYIVGLVETNCYLVWSPATREAVVIDPGGETEEILADLQRLDLSVRMVINTHGHADHILGNKEIIDKTGAVLAIGAEDARMLTKPVLNLSGWFGAPYASPAPDRLLRRGDEFTVGEAVFTVRSTPGHTPGGISLIGAGLAFTGDTLFAGSIGRTDFPGGGQGILLASIARELLTLPDATVVHPGHGPSSSIGAEKSGNPFLLG